MNSSPELSRRDFLLTTIVGSVVGIAGCAQQTKQCSAEIIDTEQHGTETGLITTVHSRIDAIEVSFQDPAHTAENPTREIVLFGTEREERVTQTLSEGQESIVLPLSSQNRSAVTGGLSFIQLIGDGRVLETYTVEVSCE